MRYIIKHEFALDEEDRNYIARLSKALDLSEEEVLDSCLAAGIDQARRGNITKLSGVEHIKKSLLERFSRGRRT